MNGQNSKRSSKSDKHKEMKEESAYGNAKIRIRDLQKMFSQNQSNSRSNSQSKISDSQSNHSYSKIKGLTDSERQKLLTNAIAERQRLIDDKKEKEAEEEKKRIEAATKKKRSKTKSKSNECNESDEPNNKGCTISGGRKTRKNKTRKNKRPSSRKSSKWFSIF